jgi:hypothetical protein
MHRRSKRQNRSILLISVLGFALLASFHPMVAGGANERINLRLVPEAAARASENIQTPQYNDNAKPDFPSSVYETGSQFLAEAIVYLRDLMATTAKPVPPAIRHKLEPYFEQHILDKARYSTEWNPTIRAGLRQLIDTNRFFVAVTLDYVIVFSDEESLNNMWLWIHELKHVEQYDRWGVKSFAANYLLNHGMVEQEANDYARMVLRKMARSNIE